MKPTLILTTLFAALAAASPAVELENRQSGTIRVQLSDDATDTGVQADIPKGQTISIASKFGNLGAGVPANRALVVSGSGSCDIFRDSSAKQKVATIKSGGNSVTFTRVQLNNGVIVCK